MTRFEPTVVAGPDFRLRPPVLDDVDAITAACQDPTTQHWLPLPRPYDVEQARYFVEDFATRQLQTGSGIVFVVEDDAGLDGAMDLKNTDWCTGCTEIGYWAAPWARGRGLTTRAVHVLSRWALATMGLQRVELRVADGNAASIAVAQGAGFVREGLARNAGVTGHGRVDLHVYSLIAADLA